MKTLLKSTIVLLLILCSLQFVKAQDADKTVTLVVSGSGKTQDEAKQNALRSAIEQAFGTFISSKTEILNDNLVKDEIVSLANGNIQKFEIISEVQIPEGGFAITLNAAVSVTKLTSFAENKGVEVEFKGGIFASNIRIQKLNDINEVSSTRNLCETSKDIIDKMFDYSISSDEPKSADGNSDKWEVILNVGIKNNSNFILFRNYFNSCLKSISLNEETVKTYKSLNKKIYPIKLITDVSTEILYFRNEKTLALLQDLVWYIDFKQADFIINDDIKEFSIYEHVKKNCEAMGYSNNRNATFYCCEFELYRKFEANWVIHSDIKRSQYWGQNFYYGPYWGTAYKYCNNNPQNCFTNKGSSYEVTKENTFNLWKKITDEKLQNEAKIIDIKTNFPGNLIITDLEGYVKEANDKLSKFEDSTNVIIYNSEGLNFGYHPIDDTDLFEIYLNPPLEEFGKYYVKKFYTTDELGLINKFSVKAAK
jgi:hypothetical protein